MAEMVTISAERLAKLEALEAKKKAREAITLQSARAFDKAHPDRPVARAKASKDRNREAYNARRRELYRLKQGGVGCGGTVKPNPETPGTL